MKKIKFQSNEPVLAKFTDTRLATMFCRIFSQNFTNKLGVQLEDLNDSNLTILITITDLDFHRDENTY